MQVPGVVLPFSLICMHNAWAQTWKGQMKDDIQNKQEESVRKHPAEQQTDVSEDAKDKSKYGVTGIEVPNPRVSRSGSHIFGHSNKSWKGRHKLRLCQQMRAIQSPRARRCDWLTSAHLITVRLFSNENTKTHQVYSVFASRPVFAVCCRVFLAAWVNPQRSRQTNRQMSSVLAPLSSFTSNWLKTGCTELLHTSQSVFLWSRAHIHVHTLMNAPQIFRCEHTSTTPTEGAMFIHIFIHFFFCMFAVLSCRILSRVFFGTLQLVILVSWVQWCRANNFNKLKILNSIDSRSATWLEVQRWVS